MDKPVLVFSDPHFPFHHERAFDHLWDVYSRWGCDRVVCAGDLADFHRASRFISETDASSAVDEYYEFLECVGKLTDMFPEGTLVLGNHDNIPQRQMKDIGLPRELLKDPTELYGLGDGWVVEDLYHVIEFDGYERGVLVEHGVGSTGKCGAINSATAKRTSFIQGHTHAYAGIEFRANHKDDIFGMNLGCLADESALAQRYGKYSTNKGVVGCGVVFSPEDAIYEKMRR